MITKERLEEARELILDDIFDLLGVDSETISILDAVEDIINERFDILIGIL